MTPYRPIGGRGHKESYETKVIRVPTAIIPYIDVLSDKYYDAYRECKLTSDNPGEDAIKVLANEKISREFVIDMAYAILSHKKSARVSMEKLLQVIFADDSIKL